MEILMVILLIGILSYVSIGTIGDTLEEGRFNQTVMEMENLRDALVGDANIKEAGTRQHFGYLGDMGSLPSNAQGLQALLTNPGLPGYSVDSSVRFGLGWSGPYISADLGGDVLTDGWGRSYAFNFSANPATLTSLGADGASGGSRFDQDITVSIPRSVQYAEVHGFISDNGGPYTGDAEVEIYYPDGAGAVASSLVTLAPSDEGHFSFSNVPFGHRSVRIFIPSKTSPTQTYGPVLFTVDRANYVIPSSSTNYALSGSGGSGGSGGGSGGGGGTGGGGGATCTAGVITYAAGTASIGGGGKVSIFFDIDLSQSVNVSGIKFQALVKDPQADLVDVTGIQRGCSDLSPCPLGEQVEGSFASAVPVSAGTGRSVRIDFDQNMQSETNLTVTFYHELGCDRVGVTDL